MTIPIFAISFTRRWRKTCWMSRWLTRGITSRWQLRSTHPFRFWILFVSWMRTSIIRYLWLLSKQRSCLTSYKMSLRFMMSTQVFQCHRFWKQQLSRHLVIWFSTKRNQISIPKTNTCATPFWISAFRLKFFKIRTSMSRSETHGPWVSFVTFIQLRI